MKQKTIKNSIVLSGVGLHTGKTITATIKPAPAQHGIKFQRVDLDGAPVIAADATKVAQTNRGTVLQQDAAVVSTVEHLLSGLMGCGVDNALVEVDGPEIPILDGSAQAFVQAVADAGTEEQDAEREYFEITEPIHFKDEATGSEYWALPAEEYSLTVLIDFNSAVLGQQFAELNSLETYASDIAPARTFVFLHELEILLNQGLIKGGDLNNAVVIADKLMSDAELSALAQKLGKPSVKIEREGVLNTTDLRFRNEPARHKLLDVIGDLALMGKFIKGKIVATKPGHTSNVAFAKLLKKYHADWKKQQEIPKYDPSVKPVMDTMAIARKLPHRFPFLLVDKVIEISTQHIIAVKQITMNEWFFQGHFPDNPVFPGVLQVEALAQTGGLLALANTNDEEKWDTYFLKIDNCKFKDKVLPGDTLIFKMELLEPIRRGIVHMQGRCFVGNKLVSEAELTAIIQKRS